MSDSKEEYRRDPGYYYYTRRRNAGTAAPQADPKGREALLTALKGSAGSPPADWKQTDKLTLF